ncbi:16S rRNA (guanine(966)-N(2))-methyltransferase RsmD [Microcoleus sp. FACHB-1515]|uniref:16S rRNA (guanine(966)-N(2))-methyltransferase RsmD n=1 Tax=Cyanophyceae TaxID=3028117 RepID=UPI001681CBD7|nr:16S rRNA (guanine(966)-N(2))-methyltransferase RsmD [Microcoleus sp. FACHB-1515]MBD2089664.1 16S rRNA (guanine(966)-N(2))-methyltransferase RsmD [Microcoleus sp. FACHB-1515]
MTLRIHGNRPLKTLPGLATRPTPARVREAIFNIWHGAIAGCRWLDLCAGSGAMGAEALSRGAALVVGIEQSAPACSVIRQNWQSIARPDQEFRIWRGDVVQQLSRLHGQAFDRIYFDPPYASALYAPVLDAIARHHLLDAAGELAVEHSPDRSLPVPEGLTPYRQKIYGNTAVSFYCWH